MAGVSLFSPASASGGLALLSAVAWGGGDFSGGMGVKAVGGSIAGALRLVAVAHAMSLLALLIVLGAVGFPVPAGAPMVWGLVAGVAAGLSLTAFYVALASGAMGASAAISGLLAAAIPAGVSLWLDGAPAPLRVLGFLLAAAAIWLIAATAGGAGSSSETQRRTMGLAIGGGIGFGVYFVALRFANGLGVLEPMALARVGSLATCLVLLALVGPGRSGRVQGAARSVEAKPRFLLSGAAWRWALGVAILDTGGNLLFIAATRRGRLDVAAVLAALYPASTILLAAWLLKESPTRRQMVGMALAVVAVVLITV